MTSCTPVSTPGLKSWSSEEHDDEQVDPELHSHYRHVVGKLQFITEERPDIGYTVKEVSRALAAPTYLDFRKVKRIGRYLSGTMHDGLFMAKDGADLSAVDVYVDANWAKCSKTRKSTSGLVIRLGTKVILHLF